MGEMAIHTVSKLESISMNILCKSAMRKLSRDRDRAEMAAVSKKGFSKLMQ